jgi:hypothetical protein
MSFRGLTLVIVLEKLRTMQTVEMEDACEFEPRRPLHLLIKIHSTLKS